MEIPNTKMYEYIDTTIYNTQKKNSLEMYKYNTNCYSDEEFEAQIEEDIIAEAHLAEIEAEMENYY